jgi:hypothetical protein
LGESATFRLIYLENAMRLVFRVSMMTALAALLTPAGVAVAGDDGAAPLWEGIGSIVSPLVGFGKDEKDPIEYREHGKIVVPKAMDLPEPNAGPTASRADWPLNQEIQRKKLAKERQKELDRISGNEPAKMRAVRSFPNAPVTVNAGDQPDGAPAPNGGGAPAQSSSFLGNLNPLGWAGIGKSNALGPEPDREWLTDPPKGYREPVARSSTGVKAAGQASN